MNASLPATEILTLVCPDWRQQEFQLRLADPFVLWPIGDQPLLYHWFDHALDQGYKHVRILASDRANRVREAVQQATLWPISIEVVTTSQPDSHAGALMHGLPEQNALLTPKDEWELLGYWIHLDKTWLAASQSKALDINLSVGRLCRIHPSVKLIPPYLIGDHVAIGPGATIGPNAVLGNGSMIAESTIVRSARVMPHSFLGAHLTLENSILLGGVLYNHKNKARIERIDSFIADSTQHASSQKTPCRERIKAFGWWLRFRTKLLFGLPNHSPQITLSDHRYPGISETPLWAARLPRLWEAACGRMRLFGPLPRSDEQLEALPIEWQSILREATPGAFAYSDCLGCHHTEDPAEALHAVYQITHPEQTTSQCEYFIQQLTHHQGSA
ncbi:hypothetical protein [Cerasicoccus maritimus]|uniref:hypothetical protein n=1 Tax=Cerasicoccus maritimus TaxID=490089 RepID=UPI002852AA98|nr:hypothetical protein [Cerasicoccus maritimus]